MGNLGRNEIVFHIFCKQLVVNWFWRILPFVLLELFKWHRRNVKVNEVFALNLIRKKESFPELLRFCVGFYAIFRHTNEQIQFYSRIFICLRQKVKENAIEITWNKSRGCLLLWYTAVNVLRYSFYDTQSARDGKAGIIYCFHCFYCSQCLVILLPYLLMRNLV